MESEKAIRTRGASRAPHRGVLAEALATLRPPRGDRHGPLAPVLVLLTVVTGIVDAASYLLLGHVFVANMTGNVVFLGFAIAGAGGVSLSSSLVAIAAFLLGALLGGSLASRTAEHRGRMLRTATVVQAALVAVALVLALVLSAPTEGDTRFALLVPLALALGVQNAAAQRLAVPELTTTVLTRTLTGLASEARIAGGPGAQAGRRLVAVGAMLLGALSGGLLVVHASVAAAAGLALALIIAVAILMQRLTHAQGAWVRA